MNILVPAMTAEFVITQHTANSLSYRWAAVQSATKYRIVVRNASNDEVVKEVSSNQVKVFLIE